MTDATRQRITLAAMELFWEKGFASTSVADILQRAKANSGSLYHFFPGKQDLLLAVLDAYHGGIGEMLLEPAWGGIADPIEKIFALLRRYRELIEQTGCFYGCPIGSLALELHEPDPAVRERLAANFAAWTDAVHECLVAAGERLPTSVDRRALAEFVLTTMEGGVMQARTFRSIGHFDRSVEQLRQYLAALEERAGRGTRTRNKTTRTRRRNSQASSRASKVRSIESPTNKRRRGKPHA